MRTVHVVFVLLGLSSLAAHAGGDAGIPGVRVGTAIAAEEPRHQPAKNIVAHMIELTISAKGLNLTPTGILISFFHGSIRSSSSNRGTAQALNSEHAPGFGTSGNRDRQPQGRAVPLRG